MSPERTSTSSAPASALSAQRTASPVPSGSLLHGDRRSPSNASAVSGEATTTSGSAPSGRAASTTQSTIRRPRIGCRCFGVAERMRVPRPPAMTTAASLGAGFGHGRHVGWGARIRTWDHGTKTRCLTAWPRPSESGRRVYPDGPVAPAGSAPVEQEHGQGDGGEQDDDDDCQQRRRATTADRDEDDDQLGDRARTTTPRARVGDAVIAAEPDVAARRRRRRPRRRATTGSRRRGRGSPRPRRRRARPAAAAGAAGGRSGSRDARRRIRTCTYGRRRRSGVARPSTLSTES